MKKNLTHLYILATLLLFQFPLFYFRITTINSSLINLLYASVLLGEFLIILGLFFIFTNKIHQKIKFISTFFLFFIILIYNSLITSQTYSLYLINSYIPAVAFLNKESYRIFITPITISLIALIILLSLTQAYAIFKISKNHNQFQIKELFFSFLLIIIGTVLLFTCGGTSKYSNPRQINGPVVEFFVQNQKTKSLSSYLETGIVLPNLEEKKWIRNTVYTSNKQFLSSSEQPNIIILVPDGIPARLINGYQKLWGNTNNPLKDLTPNIDKMMKKSFVIDNYYNHTAATYPGLVGTFTSSYPYRGIMPKEIEKITASERPAPNFSSLFDILRLNGYPSCSISSNGEEVFIPQLFHDIMKVDTAYFPDTIKEINSDAPAFKYLTDNEIFNSIKNILTQKNNQPVAIVTYFLGTHLNFNPLKLNGIGYHDNSNIFLNALHNFDHELGNFMNWLEKSPFAENTLVILTTNHTHYPDKEYTTLMDQNPSLAKNFQPYFTDKIPFIIYNTHKLPSYYDAEGKTSLYFAPTLLHILGHKNYRNSFLERSIFDEKLPAHEPFVYIDAANIVLCIIDNHINTLEFCRKNESFNKKIEKIKIYQKLESKGLLFDNKY